MADDAMLDKARFNTMAEGTAEDWAAIARAGQGHRGKHVDRILDNMRLLDGDHGGFAVDRLEHSLQTATRAHGQSSLRPARMAALQACERRRPLQ